MTTTQGATDRAQQAAGTAADEGRHVAETARAEAGNVASEAASQARTVLDDAVTQVSAQTREQTGRLGGTLQTFGDDLDQMAESGSGLAADVARQVAGQARGLGAHLSDREPADLLQDVRDFARRRPGVFLLGALTAGVVAGRLARGAVDGAAAASASTSDSTVAGVAPTASGTAPTGTPTTSPPMPSVPHGAPTMDAPTLDQPGPVGGPETGYGARSGLPEEGPR